MNPFWARSQRTLLLLFNMAKKHVGKVPKASRQIASLQERLDVMGEGIVDIESKFFHSQISTNLMSSVAGAEVARKRKRDYTTEGHIPKPAGRAGKGGAKGYNLREALGLGGKENEQIYLSLLVRNMQIHNEISLTSAN